MNYDYTNRLGFVKMPEGYKLIGLDSGHFLWWHEESDNESAIHWNKWAVYKWAWEEYRSNK